MELKRRGDTASTTVNELLVVARLGSRLGASGASAARLSGQRVEFVALQRAAGTHPRPWSRPGSLCSVELLRRAGIASRWQPGPFDRGTAVDLEARGAWNLERAGAFVGAGVDSESHVVPRRGATTRRRRRVPHRDPVWRLQEAGDA